MSRRKVAIILICEDSQQEVFARNFLLNQGWKRHQIRSEICPAGSQSGEQFVKEKFVQELPAFRSRCSHVSCALIVLIDADQKLPADRLKEVENICAERKIAFRAKEENILFIIPKRNIETWLEYLENGKFDENTEYRKKDRERDCIPMAKTLVEMCQRDSLDEPFPASLKSACDEYKNCLALQSHNRQG